MLCGPSGRRTLKCADFTTGIYATELAPDEIIECVRIPKLSAQARWGYSKLCRKMGEFASALAVVVADPGRGYARVVLGAVNGAPLVLQDTSRLVFAGGGGDIRAAISADLDRAADRHFDAFQRGLHAVAAMRAVQQATA
jgi:carbon-monoxide dehydrogenase medium subunit